VKKEFIIERQGKSFVLYAGLLEEAHAQGLKRIETELLQIPTPENGHVAICKATVQTEKGIFTGLGDASPENVSKLMSLHLIRMAETRAKARALRDAVNVGVAALEELAEDEPEPTRTSEADSLERDNTAEFAPSTEARAISARSITEKQLNAIYAIAQNSLNMSREEVDEKCQSIYGHSPQELTRWEASRFIDMLKADRVA